MIDLVTLLLLIIAASELTRLYLTHRSTSQKRHFESKRDGVQKMIWDQEFKLFKTREIREEIRQTYEQTKARLAVMDAQLKDWPKDMPIEDKPGMEDQKVRLERDLKRYEEQMKNLDVEMEGSKPTNDFPDGFVGIKMEIDNLIELKGMIEDHIKANS